MARVTPSQVGRVLRSLHASGLDNTTLTVLLSDHGYKLGHFSAWGKHSLMRADTRVPLITYSTWQSCLVTVE